MTTRPVVDGTGLQTLKDALNAAIAFGSIVPSVSSIAALKAVSVTSLTTGYRTDTLGYYANGDGGSNSFYYDSASSATDNGGTIIQPTTGTGRWLAVNTNEINVKQFGAKGDSDESASTGTDDTTAIRNACAATQGIVFVPAGFYKVTDYISVRGGLVGAYLRERNASVIVSTNGNAEILRLVNNRPFLKFLNIKYNTRLTQSLPTGDIAPADKTVYWAGACIRIGSGINQAVFENLFLDEGRYGIYMEEPFEYDTDPTAVKTGSISTNTPTDSVFFWSSSIRDIRIDGMSRYGIYLGAWRGGHTGINIDNVYINGYRDDAENAIDKAFPKIPAISAFYADSYATLNIRQLNIEHGIWEKPVVFQDCRTVNIDTLHIEGVVATCTGTGSTAAEYVHFQGSGTSTVNIRGFSFVFNYLFRPETFANNYDAYEATGTITSGSNVITGVSSVSGLRVGDLINVFGDSTLVCNNVTAVDSGAGTITCSQNFGTTVTSEHFTITVKSLTTSPTAGAVYTNNGSTFQVLATGLTGSPASGRLYLLRTAGTNPPSTDLDMTKSSGTGDSTITAANIGQVFTGNTIRFGFGATDIRVFEFNTTSAKVTIDGLRFSDTDILYTSFDAACSARRYVYTTSNSGSSSLKFYGITTSGNAFSTSDLNDSTSFYPTRIQNNESVTYAQINNKVFRVDSAAPTTGTWAVGDVVFNSAPTAGGFVGWVCTTAGTPGTWKTFGVISA